MMQRSMLPAFHNRARLAIPADQRDALDRRLRDAGVDPARWFCVLHYREPTYGPRGAESIRDIDPDFPIAMTKYIAGELGGQVVRVGHPGMRRFPDIPGFVDLAGVADPGFLHAHAVSRARFFYELSPSGPLHFSWALGTPAARCNAVQGLGPLEESSLVLLRRFEDRDGASISLRRIVDSELLVRASSARYRDAHGISLLPNTLDELRRAARDILARTRDCPGWRQAVALGRVPPSNRFDWPLRQGYRHPVMAYWDPAEGVAGDAG